MRAGFTGRWVVVLGLVVSIAASLARPAIADRYYHVGKAMERNVQGRFTQQKIYNRDRLRRDQEYRIKTPFGRVLVIQRDGTSNGTGGRTARPFVVIPGLLTGKKSMTKEGVRQSEVTPLNQMQRQKIELTIKSDPRFSGSINHW